MLLPVTYRYVAVAAAPVTRSDDTAFVGGDDDDLACEICLTRFPCCVARDIRAAALTVVERGWRARRRVEDKKIMVMGYGYGYLMFG